MKKALSSLIISLFVASAAIAFEGGFTKDPTCPGGLYLITVGEGFTCNLYYSDDFGETLQIVVADTFIEGGIIADPVPGYLISHYGSINLSTDYGVSWRWMGSTPYNISAGRYPGEMYTFDYIPDRIIKYSLNYGGSWDIHYPSGLLVDDLMHAVGNLESEFYVLDTDNGELYRSTDFGDNFIYMSSLPVGGGGNGTKIHKGALPVELYYFNGYTGDLFFSGDSGMSFDWTYHFSDTTQWDYAREMQGGSQTGDVFVAMVKGYSWGGGEIFIYYSDDYGYNFTEFHPFSTTIGLPYVNLTPLDTTSFPASGGILEYNIEGRNLGPVAYIGDIWCDVTLPDSSIYGPVLGPIQDFYFGSYWIGDRDRELNIPGGAPAGTYTLNVYIGEYDPINPTIDAEDHLEFIKSGVDYHCKGSWFVEYGELFEQEYKSSTILPDELKFDVYPNPFNPTTTISFTLLQACWVKLEVFDITGRRVIMSGSGATPTTALLDGWRDTGHHEVTFDGSGLASGIYIYRLQAGDFIASGKMVLMK